MKMPAEFLKPFFLCLEVTMNFLIYRKLKQIVTAFVADKLLPVIELRFAAGATSAESFHIP